MHHLTVLTLTVWPPQTFSKCQWISTGAILSTWGNSMSFPSLALPHRTPFCQPARCCHTTNIRLQHVGQHTKIGGIAFGAALGDFNHGPAEQTWIYRPWSIMLKTAYQILLAKQASYNKHSASFLSRTSHSPRRYCCCCRWEANSDLAPLIPDAPLRAGLLKLTNEASK